MAVATPLRRVLDPERVVAMMCSSPAEDWMPLWGATAYMLRAGAAYTTNPYRTDKKRGCEPVWPTASP
jgi:hypothetical protein